MKDVPQRRMLAVAAVGVIAGFGLGTPSLVDDTDPGDPFAKLPARFTITATVRDFKAHNVNGGHPDFERWTGGARVGMVAPELDTEGKPVALSIVGRELIADYRDAQNQPINPALYDPAQGDRPGRLTTATGNRIYSATSFAAWYRDGLNFASTTVPITLTRLPRTNRYTFDAAVDARYKARGGYFPIDDALYGNGDECHNFGFTTELDAQFQYTRGAAQMIKVSGDGDAWVFIGGRLVIDLGGVTCGRSQGVTLDRLPWLTSGGVYTLKIFHANRRSNQSAFRIDTTLQIRQVHPPAGESLVD